MKKILYISNLDLNKKTGVEKKILSQIKALRNLNTKVSYIGTKGNNICYCTEKESLNIGKVSENKVLRQLGIIKENIKMIEKSNDIDLIYIRHILCTPQMIKLLKVAQKKKIKVVEELPTYPYDEELKNGTRMVLKIALVVDKFYRKKLKKYLKNIVTLSDDDEIFGIKTIKINNGVDVDNIEPIDIIYDDRVINMIAVSAMEYWQGYDRLINALKKYYDNKQEKDPEIIIHMVGDGSELGNLKKMVQKLELEKNVVFYGFLSGKNLDEVYKKCQCAVAGLGIFRKNIKNAKTLKIREYVSKAIPFIYSTNDKSITDFKYSYKVSDDEEIFDMKDIVLFLNGLNKNLIKGEMRSFAEQNFKWENQMDKVLKMVF